ncbi:MAG: hypothetical protein AAGE93_04465 [Bacteroidota bacterium]
MLAVDNVEQVADLVFVISDSAYYFLSMIDNLADYEKG